MSNRQIILILTVVVACILLFVPVIPIQGKNLFVPKINRFIVG